MRRDIIDASSLELEDKVVSIKRVTKVVKGGRNFRFTALVVVGDKNGHVGAGLGKAAEIPEAIRKGKEDAIKKLIHVPIDENGSVPHDFIGKFGSAQVLLKNSQEAKIFFKNNNINLRFVTIELSNGTKEVLVTNLTSDKMSYENIKELYHLRWNIETSYRTLKSQMKLEEFSGYLVDIIKQDIYISVMLYNLISGIINENKPEIDETKYKYKMKVNRNFSIGIIKSYFIQIILADNEKKKTLQNEMITQIQKHIVPIRRDINNKRKRNTKNKCSMSYKKSF